jgi:hypothetical protein
MHSSRATDSRRVIWSEIWEAYVLKDKKYEYLTYN